MAEHIRVLLTEEEVDKRIQEIGEQISKDYAFIRTNKLRDI